MSVTAQPECAWTVSTQANWISELAPASGQGNGSFAFRAGANTTASRREADIVVNDNRVRVSQDPAPCLFEISPSSQTVPASGATGTIAVTVLSGCPWTATISDSWITITSSASGDGNGTISYRVAANGNAGGRTGSISIGNRTFSITQEGQPGPAPPPTPNCTYSLSASSQTAPAAGSIGNQVTVTAPAGCGWTAISNATWISVTGGASGTSNGTVTFTVALNTGALRNGTITIAGHTFTVTQAAAAAPTCTYSLAPNPVVVGVGGGTRSITVTAPAGCAWTATESETWITISSGASGTGPGTIVISISINTLAIPRSGTITFSGQGAAAQSIVVNQGIL